MMAAKPKNNTARGNTKNTVRKSQTGRKSTTRASRQQQESFRDEVILLSILAICILLFISNLGIGGFLGNKVSSVNFGIFGIMAYVSPICFFIGAAFFISNRKNGIAIFKLVAALMFVVFLCLFVELVAGNENIYSVKASFSYAVANRSGGGAVGGFFAWLLCPAIGKLGAYVVDIIALIISMVILTERSFLGGVKKGSQKVYDTAKEDAQKRREVKELKREERALRMDNKVEGVAIDTKIGNSRKGKSDNISELTAPVETAFSKEVRDNLFAANKEVCHEPVEEIPLSMEPAELPVIHAKPFEMDSIPIESAKITKVPIEENEVPFIQLEPENIIPEPVVVEKVHRNPKPEKIVKEETETEIAKEISKEMELGSVSQKEIERTYVFPPVELLTKGTNAQGDTKKHLQETAIKLQQTLKTFGVNVTITQVSCGPSVTRYELQPEMGVKVSKIVNLADDIKLNLAAADIRIEAPIPGKAAVGIEVPNKENVMVRFRDMIESGDFQKHKSSICFTAGKDIGGQVVVADIAKMPHLLIAGATGSGKSVCINTIIMSILYKANPEDVKLILIDPKVVELSVYNGIPHLFIPVVTDPKKAAGALHWAVAEMTDRYQKFAEYQVRDLKGYNQKVEAIEEIEDETKPQKMPQIVIVVDELADLMMVAPGDVEDAICRLAQLARAAGIHLIIATQRPSVDVITGLIKANMPSRIAFSVSSGVDSRTILDMNGAEKLLGNGDMLFYPQGYQKPLRVQGPFVSDTEVEAVVDFLKKQSTVVYSAEMEEKMNRAVNGNESLDGSSKGDDRDAYFVEAGKFVIEKDKGSIGMLQRMFKIGFNRAARIMDQLEESGVVGTEDGTKPRKILMSLSEFEEYVEEYI
ncbi:MAG: DNA translocase FtsK [Lachnospiraceae bacterium]